MKPDELCKGRTKHLLPMMEYIDSLNYEDEPDYELIRDLFDTMKLIQPQSDLDWQRLTP